MLTPPDEWRARGREFFYGGHRIFYRDEGAGEALLCLHGFPTASWDWHVVWPHLIRRHRVVAADMVGFGFSAKPRDHEYSLFDQAMLQEALLAELGIRRAHLLAHDYGDTVALELLARTRERKEAGTEGPHFDSLCLLNGGLFPEAIRPRPIQKLLIGPLGGLVARFVTEGIFRRSFRSVFGPETRPTGEELAAFWSLIRENDGQRVAHRVSRYQVERRRHRERWIGALVSAEIPIRLIWGPEDPVSGRAILARLRKLVPDADVVVLDDVGHYPQVEAPGRVVEALFEFLSQVESGGP